MNDIENTTLEPGTPKPPISNRMYDTLKYISLVILPAISAFYFGLGDVWNLPKVTEVVGTIAVLDTVCGLILNRISINYRNSDHRFDGHIDVVEDEGAKLYSLNVDGDPAEVLDRKAEVTFKVNKDETPVELEELVETPKPRKRTPRKKV